MAYINQQEKKELKKGIDATIKALGLKGKLKYTLAIRNHSTLVMTIKSSPIDFIANHNARTEERNRSMPEHMKIHLATDHIDVNSYWIHDHFTGEAKNVLTGLMAAMNAGNHDNSDAMSDYFDVGWYVDIKIGKWDKPYELTK